MPKGTPRPTGARALVQQLERLGVEVVFGIPGVHNLDLFDALRSSPIRTVLVRHEQTAGFAADGYARATGRLGVCITTTGPGAANAAAAMGEARAARVPVLHISTQIADRLLRGKGGRFSLHESPHQREMMSAICVWSGTVARAEAIASMVARAARAAFEGRRGPAFLEIPNDMLAAAVPASATAASGPTAVSHPPPDPRLVARAVAALRSSKRPIIWAGGGAVSSGAGPEVAALAERIGAPVVTTFAGKGIVPSTHPLAVGLPPHQPEVTAMLRNADAMVVVGSDLDGMNTQGWRLRLPRPRIAINTLASDARRNYAADVVIEADAAEALRALAPEVGERSSRDAARRVERARAAARGSLRADKGLARGARFVERLTRALPEDAAVVADMAVGGYWMAGYWRAPEPRRFAYPLGWGTLGYALPAAVGVAASGRRCLVVAGDAGALYGIGELATAAQESLEIVVLIVDDAGYGMLRFDAEERFGAAFATDLTSPDFVGLGASFGIASERVTLTSLERAVKAAFARGGPSVLVLKAALAPPITTSPRWPLKGKPEARP